MIKLPSEGMNFIKKQSFQPTPIFVGDPQNFVAFYVLLNDQKFEVASPIEAIELTFHLYMVLHASYAVDCKLVWLLIQNLIYDISTAADKRYITLTNILPQIRKPTPA